MFPRMMTGIPACYDVLRPSCRCSKTKQPLILGVKKNGFLGGFKLSISMAEIEFEVK